MEKRRIEEQNDYEVGVCMEKKVMLYGNSNPFICRLFSSFQTTVSSSPGCLVLYETLLFPSRITFALQWNIALAAISDFT